MWFSTCTNTDKTLQSWRRFVTSLNIAGNTNGMDGPLEKNVLIMIRCWWIGEASLWSWKKRFLSCVWYSLPNNPVFVQNSAFGSFRSYLAQIKLSKSRAQQRRTDCVAAPKSKIVSPSVSPCFTIVDGKRFERHNFSVLLSVLLKMHIWAQLIESFSRPYGLWSCAEEKLSILRQAHHML